MIYKKKSYNLQDWLQGIDTLQGTVRNITISWKLKLAVYKTVQRPKMLYGSETLVMEKKEEIWTRI